ncbi:MFS transporter [Streptomyces albulus]|nr:MFS transporter [Streptomyces noursei]
MAESRSSRPRRRPPRPNATRPAPPRPRRQARHPFLSVLRDAWRTWLLASGAFLITVGGYYIVVTFMSTYAVDDLGFSDSQAAGAGTAASLVVIVCTPLAALAADRFGLRRITLIGILLHVAVAFPMFWLAETRSVPGLWLAMCLPMLASTVAYAAIGTLVSGWFTPRTRYTGLSMSFQTAGLAGTLAPAATTWLFTASGNSWTPVALAFAAMALLSACAWSPRDGGAPAAGGLTPGTTRRNGAVGARRSPRPPAPPALTERRRSRPVPAADPTDGR